MPHHIFNIPEVLQPTFGLLSKRDLARLSRVSRDFFACSVPLLWRELKEAMPLINLLPVDDGILSSNKRSTDVLNSLNIDALKRFNLYAPYVKTMKYGITDGCPDRPWLTLAHFVPSRPLLPNLQIVEFDMQQEVTGPWWDSIRVTELPAIEPYLSASLLEVRTSGSDIGCFQPALVSALAAAIAKICPSIGVLQLYPGSYPSMLESALLGSPTVYSSLAKFADLRVLGTSPDILYPAGLCALGSLPKLETLHIYATGTTDHTIEPNLRQVVLREGSLPALKHIAMSSFPWATGLFCQLWENQPVVQQLKLVHIALEGEEDWGAVHRLLLSVCHNGHSIIGLSFGAWDLPVAISSDGWLSPAILEQLALLPLRYLRVRGLNLPLGHHRCELLAQALRNLECLSVLGPPVDVPELITIAKYMRKLQFLEIEMNDDDWAGNLPELTEPNTDDLNTPAPPLCLKMLYPVSKDLSSIDKHVEGISGFLYSLWPNGVQYEHFIYDWSKGKLDQGAICTLINNRIKDLCAPHEFHVASVGREEWAHEIKEYMY